MGRFLLARGPSTKKIEASIKTFRGLLGAAWDVCVASLALLVGAGASWGASWRHLDPFWVRLGAIMGPSLGVFGPSWTVFKASWGILRRVGVVWRGFGGVFGPSWVVLGASSKFVVLRFETEDFRGPRGDRGGVLGPLGGA